MSHLAPCARSATPRLVLLATLVAGSLLLHACSGSDAGTPGSAGPEPQLLVAPFVEGLTYCDEAVGAPGVEHEDDAAALCASLGKTGARRVNALLDAVGPATSPSGRYRLGYTLNLPVFRFYKRVGNDWVFDHAYLQSALKLIAEVDRPVVVFMSADHFAVTNEALTRELVQDSRNLMHNRDGPMQPAIYFRNPIVAWTLADERARANVMRTEAFRAVRDGLCRLPQNLQERIAAVSVLGETHKMFPNLEAGPRYDRPMYEAGDYSPVSVAGFRVWLSQKYNGIAHLNADLGSSYRAFDEIEPPRRDIQREVLNGFFDHIDAAAAGRMAVYGWFNDSLRRAHRIDVYLDGRLHAAARMGLSRTDVTAAVPQIEDPNIGFHLDLDFRRIPPGFHRLDVVADLGVGQRFLVASRRFLIGDRLQGPAVDHPSIALDAQPLAADAALIGGLDAPVAHTAVYHNPMAELWLLFRNQVVRNYVTRYADLMVPSCIPASKIFSHQLAPTLYGGWNADLLAADTAQLPNPAHAQGTTLYGGTAFGSAFFEMKRGLGWDRYSVGEMHPLVPLAPAQYFDMFEAHRKGGAVFVAPYYMSTLTDQSTSGTLSDFLISAVNTAKASDRYYRSLQDLMRR
jgi:hypothetical protein